MKHTTPGAVVFAAALLIAACGADNSPTGPFDGIDWDSVDTGADTAPADTPTDTSGEPGDDPPPTGRGTIEGIVYSPEPALGADPSLTIPLNPTVSAYPYPIPTSGARYAMNRGARVKASTAKAMIGNMGIARRQ